MRSEGGRFRLAVSALLFCWLVLFGVVAWHQLVRGSHHRHQAEVQHGVRVSLPAPRGRMFDRLGRPLATNRSVSSIRILPQYAKDKDTLAAILAGFGFAERRTIRAELMRRKRHFWFRRNVPVQLADSLRRVVTRRGYSNCTLVDDDRRRIYPFGASCATVTGFLGEECGLAGLEYQFDSILRGRPGWRLLQKDALGYSHPYPSYPTVEPVPGADLYLTLDIDIQAICQQALEERVRATGALKGAAVVMEPGSGRILAVAEWPTYDPAAATTAERERHRCTAVSDVFEPGSVFKLVVMATALESPNAAELVARRYDVSSGFITIGKYKIRDAHNHGVLDFDGLMVMSSNPGCAMLSMQLDPEQYYQIARALGFGSALGVGLPDERSGTLDRPERLGTLRFANIAFGQGLTTTLLQLCAAYNCVASDGEFWRPYLIDSVCQNGRVIQRNRPVRVRRALRPETARRLKDIMEKVVTEGTGTPAAVPGVTVCGKTGTAQKTEPGGGYSNTRSRMSFVGFLPKEAPRYCIAVMVDEPKTDRFASTVAGPVFREIGWNLLRLERMRQQTEVWAAVGGVRPVGAKDPTVLAATTRVGR